MEIRRPGLVEWYENRPAGLEQGFTLARRPAGMGELRLLLSLGPARAREVRGGLRLRTPDGRELGYGGLSVSDAAGRQIPSRFELAEPGRVAIVVDDRGASYPLTVDPLLTGSADAVLEANQVDSAMGYSVAGAGDVNGDGYDDVIVGARGYDSGQVDEGTAFVFLGGPAGLASGGPTAASAVLESNQAFAHLGESVASAGDVNGDGYDDVIVGAPMYDLGQADEGAAFVFLGGPLGVASGNPFTAHATFQSNQAAAACGVSVASAGDVNGDGYDDVIVGAPYFDLGQADEGAAFVFHGSAGGLANGSPASASAVLESNQAGAALGASVASAGDVDGDGRADVVVGAPFYDLGQTDEGAAFVFHGSATGVVGNNPFNAAATIQSNLTQWALGFSVAGAGDVNGDGYADVVVGAPGFLGSHPGAVFVFHGSPSGVGNGSPDSADTVLFETQVTGFGASVAGCGDVNGDGYDDVVAGAYARGTGGQALVHLGGPAGIPSGGPVSGRVEPLQGAQADMSFGFSVAGAGDVNGDGWSDVVVGAIGYSGGESREGAAFLFKGGFVKGDFDGDLKTDLLLRHQPTGGLQAWLMSGTTLAGLSSVSPAPGTSDQVAGIDDFDGDWRNDLVVSTRGATSFWLLNGTTRIGAPVALPGGLQPPWRVAATADFDHDGRPDLVWRNSSTQKIQVWTMAGLAHQATLMPSPDHAVDGNWAVVAALDWNADHNTDFLWYNATSGKIVLWFMDRNLVRTTGQFTNPPNAGDNNWNVLAAGDYGRGANGLPATKDIVWRNATSGNMVVWHMDHAGNRTSGLFTTPSAPAPNPTDWTIAGPR